MVDKIKIVKVNGEATIDGLVCTFDSKEIREAIEDILEVNDEFYLPKRYTYFIKDSTFHGKVAKIIAIKTFKDCHCCDNGKALKNNQQCICCGRMVIFGPG